MKNCKIYKLPYLQNILEKKYEGNLTGLHGTTFSFPIDITGKFIAIANNFNSN